MLTKLLLDLATGGAEWVLWLLLVLSVISLGITIERLIWFRKRSCDVEALGRALLDKVRANDTAGASALLTADPSEEARIVSRCLEWYPHGPEAVAEVLASTVLERRKNVDQGAVFLGTLGNNAPFIGLFGTVLGVIDAFKHLGENTMGSIGTVMSGIGEALVATGVGIFVALPAVVAFNVLTRKATEIEDNAHALVGMILAQLRARG